jgi:hypothetical protein
MKLRILRTESKQVAPGEWAANPHKRMETVYRDRLQFSEDGNEWIDVPVVLEQEITECSCHEVLKDALHRISLSSQNSMSDKEECGRIARSALNTIKKYETE